MMKTYLDVRLRPDPEMSSALLMNSLFAKLHRQLVAHKPLQVGMSFPEYAFDSPSLGSIMRLHGAESDLHRLMAQDWLGGLRGYLRLADLAVATGHRHVRVRRVQTKSSPARLARRYQARHLVTDDEVIARYATAKSKRSNLPFLTVKSSTSNQSFLLFVQQEEVGEQSSGEFNCYALSRKATLAYS